MWPHGDSMRGRGHLAPDCEANCPSGYLCQLSRETHTRVAHSHTATNTLNTDRIVRGNTHSFCTCSGATDTTAGVCVWIEALPSNQDAQQHYIHLQLQLKVTRSLAHMHIQGQFRQCRVQRSISFSRYRHTHVHVRLFTSKRVRPTLLRGEYPLTSELLSISIRAAS